MDAAETMTRICLGAMIGLATIAHADPAKGPLRVHPDNPRYFTDGSGWAIRLQVELDRWEAARKAVIASAERLSFTDITATAGLGGPSGDAAGGHGAMWADITENGLPDVYLPFNWRPSLEYPDYFYANQGNFVFTEEAAARGIEDRDGGSHGAVWADLNNDGRFDLVNGATLPFGSNDARNRVYRNDGFGRFTDVTPPALAAREEVTRAVIAFDRNNNGYLDIFCVTGWRGSGDPPGERNEFYLNEGNFSFTAVTSGPLYTCPAGQGATDTDYNGDGFVDVLAANRDGPVNILRNNGDGTFMLVDPVSLGITHTAGDGITTADVNNDGHLDLLLAGDNTAHLYLNNGDGTFTHKRSFTGTRGYMGGFADLDNDGHLDLVFAGHATCYLGDGQGNFTPGPIFPNTEAMIDPRSVSFADVNGNGCLDVMLAGKQAPNKLYRNNYGGSNHWLKVELFTANGQAGAFGAKVRLYPAGQAGGTLLAMREARSNYGYLAQDDPVLHFGLGPRTQVDVVAHFLDGLVVTRSNVSANQKVTIRGR